MTYLTGLALGISAGGKLHQLLVGEGFSLVHALPGRRRYKHGDLLHNDELAVEWQRQLTKVNGINSVTVNPATGSILLEYTCREECVDLVINYLDQLHKKPDPRAAYGRFGVNIRGLCQRVNHNILENTGRNLDLRTVVALLLLVGGGFRMWKLGQRPGGPQMVWWAYSLLKGRN